MLFTNKRGQSVVEFAIVMPLFVFIMIGFLFMGVFMHDYLAMGQVTREVARFEAVGVHYNAIKGSINVGNRLTGIYTINPDTGINIQNNTNAQLGPYVTVTATMIRNDDGIIQMVSSFMPQQISNTLTMRKEN